MQLWDSQMVRVRAALVGSPVMHTHTRVPVHCFDASVGNFSVLEQLRIYKLLVSFGIGQVRRDLGYVFGPTITWDHLWRSINCLFRLGTTSGGCLVSFMINLIIVGLTSRRRDGF